MNTRDRRAPWNRVLTVARAELISWAMAFLWPLAIMGSSFALNLALFAAIGDTIPDGPTTGGLASIYVVQFIVAWTGVLQFFGFAVGLNVTRRTFYLATSLVMTGQSVAYGILLYLFELIEHATGGWGIRVSFFDPLPITHGNSPLNILVYAVPMICISFLGMFLGVVATRWGSNGIFGLTLAGTVVAGLAAVGITWLDGWDAVGSWLVSQSGYAYVIFGPLVLAVACAGAAYGLLRRANP